MAKKSDIDRREHERHPTRLAIRFRDRRNLKGEQIRNISRGGVFVCTTDPMPVGSEVDLTLEGPEGQIFQTLATVMWASSEATEPGVAPTVHDAEEVKAMLQRDSGMGIRFRTSKAKKLELETFIDSILNPPA